jgi:hypothetical protein
MRSARKVTTTIIAALAVLALTSAPAWAGSGYGSVTSHFGSPGSGPGQFKEPTSIAVNYANEDVYVLDRGNDRVEWFNSTGSQFEGQFNGTASFEVKGKNESGVATPTDGFLEPGEVTVDNDASSASYGDVYVTDVGHNAIDKFTADGEYICQITGPERLCLKEPSEETQAEKESPAFFSTIEAYVDVNGNLWVHFHSEYIWKLGESGGLIEKLKTGSGQELPRSGSSFVVDSNGYADVATGGGSEAVERTAPDGGRVGVIVNYYTASSLASLALVSSTNVLAVDEGSDIELFSAADVESAGPLDGQNPKSPPRVFPSAGLSESEGIAINGARGEGLLYATQRGADDVDVFSPGTPEAPEIVDESALTTAINKGVFSALINPNGEETTYSFEYSEEAEGEDLKGEIKTVAGESALPVEFSELEAASPRVRMEPIESTFYFRVIATNGKGTVKGKVQTFIRSPIITDENVSELTDTSAKLEATINPNYQFTKYRIYYATSEAALEKGEGIAAGHGTVEGETEGVFPVSTQLAELQPGRTYYYQVAAEDEASENVNGADHVKPSTSPIRSFTPYGPPAVATGVAQSITGNAATLSGVVNPVGAATSYYFVYADEASYVAARAAGASDPYVDGEATAPISVGEGTSAQDVGPDPIAELLPGQTYHYAIVAIDKYGLQSVGEDQTFTTPAGTPPSVSTGGASGVSQNSATLAGTVTTNGLQTNYGFEIGTEPGNYGPATGLGAIGGSATEEVSVALGELQPATTYYYRITATNADGTSKGEAGTFTTPGFPIGLTTPAAPLVVAVPNVAIPKEEALTGASASIDVLAHKVKGKTATIVLSVPSAGRLVASGRDLSQGTARASGAGEVSVKVSLTKAEQAVLSKHKGRRVKVEVALTFTPTQGSQLTARTTVLLG